MGLLNKINVFWFRRDLRFEDNHGLFHALSGELEVLPIFIFDKNILDELPPDDARVSFIYETLTQMHADLNASGRGLEIYYGHPLEVWKSMAAKYQIDTVFMNRDYEPYALNRDIAVQQLLTESGIKLQSYKDHVIFEKDEVIKEDGTPYTVFTPYKNKWIKELANQSKETVFHKYQSYTLINKFIAQNAAPILPLEEMGFKKHLGHIPNKIVSQKIILEYDKNRDFPSLEGTSKLGIHFRFGTISIRAKAKKALELNQIYLSELIWRDFYSMILFHFPHVATEAFRPAYNNILWRNNEAEFEAWKLGKTGYPLVDAGMRELNETGFMHNRVRMVSASFLSKHLLIDWRWGEAYFAEKLLDFDLASNNGGWQWAAGSGTDAAPYFRIFNPTAQEERFDKQKVYIKKWVSEYGTSAYPSPIVVHTEARTRCLETYKIALNAV